MIKAQNKFDGLVKVPGGYYDVEFEPLEEGGYLARVPALESSTFGKTLDDAQDMVADMVTGWLAVAREDDLPIPPPKPLILVESKIPAL